MRKIGWLTAWLMVLGNPAQAQLRLPGVQLPGNTLQSLQRGTAQNTSTALDELRDVRRLAIAP